MNEGQLIIKYVESEGKVHNLKRKVKELESKLKSTNQQLELYSVDYQKEVLLAYEKSQCLKTWFISKNEAECRIDEFLVANIV
jgi:hypothetical protein